MIDEDGVDELLRSRVRRKMLDDDSLRRMLRGAVRQFPQSTDDHAVWWNGTTWCEAKVWTSRTQRRLRNILDDLDDGSRDDGWRLISRAYVFGRAEDSVNLFLAAMAWGFGDRGYGWRRTASIINTAGEQRVARSVANLRSAFDSGGPTGVWTAWSTGGRAKLPGVGTAFASKVAYFASFDRASGSGPLIADANTAWSLWALAGLWDSRKAATIYRDYVYWSQQWAADLGCRPDDIERALFSLGPAIRRAWSQLR
jgi:hypothetical protein